MDEDTHFMVEQLSHVCAVMVQVWPSGQAGQVGTESHVTQRLKREREGVKPSMGWENVSANKISSIFGRMNSWTKSETAGKRRIQKKKKSNIPMGEREEGSTGLRSMMDDEEVELVNKDE